MRRSPKTGADSQEPAATRRRYDSPLRKQQAAETRERIVAAGAEIAHRLASWDWRELTFRAVGDRAGVSERTVHRHFSTERVLREAIVQRLTEESGVKLHGFELGEFAGLATQVYRYLSSFAATPPAVTDPTFAAIDQQRREALLAAVARVAPQWPADAQTTAAAMLDMLWNPMLFQRLTGAWQLDAAQTTRAIAWAAGLIEQAIRDGRRPGPARG